MHVLFAAAEACREGRRAALVTVIGAGGSTPRVSGARMLVYEDGAIVGTIGGGAFEHRAVAAALTAIEQEKPHRLQVDLTRDLGMCCGGQMQAFIEPLEVRAPMVVFGAGHVAHALVPLLVPLSLDITVVDPRDEWLTEERFVHATRRVDDPVAAARRLDGHPKALWLVATHDHTLDQDIVEALLPKESAWLGMIGSRAKVARFLVRYRAAGMDPGLFAKLSAPVGLDIGAETPAEIAISIAAEVVRVRRGHTAAPMPLSQHPLAARTRNPSTAATAAVLGAEPDGVEKDAG